MSIARALVRELVALDAGAVGRDAGGKAALCLVDFLSCAFAGAQLPYAQQAMRAARPWSFAGGVPVIASDLRLAPGEAAYLDSLLAASASRTDMHPASTSHPAAVVFPVALVCSALRPVRGRDFVAAVVAGYEAMGRLGRIVVDERFKKRFRSSSVLGTVGGAITAARLLGLDEDQAVHALALSANNAAGLMEWGHSGDVDLFHQPANAARSAITAALLAREGASASESILEGPAGFLAAFGGRDQADKLMQHAAAGWEIELIEYKPVPACVFVQAAAFATRSIVRDHGAVGGEVESVKLRTFASAVAYPGCDNAGPIDGMQPARMSLQYTVASVLARGELTDHNFADIDNPMTRSLVPRVCVEVADEFSDAFPERQGAEVEVRLRTGAMLRARVDEVPPMVPARVRERFRHAASGVLDAPRIARLEAACLDCASMPDAAALIDMTTTTG
jgi:2-methylcitrate dehydratase PrpD